MSEFKFACPVCGQHMMCDASQAGTVMDCPTCFQKIVAPQAPAPDAKFILTGTKLTEKKINVRGVDAPAVATAEKSFPLWIVLALAGVVAAGAAGFFIWQATHKPPPPPPPVAKVPKKIEPPKPAPPPPASDTNWTLTLGTNGIPDTPVAGRIHGQDFLMERALFQNGTLTLRAGGKGPVEFGVQISFGGAVPAESLSGQSLNILADTNKSARVTLRWRDADGETQKESYDINYAMRLEFGPLANNKLPGKIWLCTPDDQKSYLLGAFRANANKPKPKPQPK